LQKHKRATAIVILQTINIEQGLRLYREEVIERLQILYLEVVDWDLTLFYYDTFFWIEIISDTDLVYLNNWLRLGEHQVILLSYLEEIIQLNSGFNNLKYLIA
jgi:hypothetical protein